MIPSRLPANPSLAHLRAQAKKTVRQHRQGDPRICQLISALHPRFAGLTPREVAQRPFALHDALLCIARYYGFASWPKLKKRLEATAATKASGTDHAANPLGHGQKPFSNDSVGHGKPALEDHSPSPLVTAWSEALSNRDLKNLESLLAENDGLAHQPFFPREKLPHYHSATYEPLLWGVWNDDFEVVRLLLNYGADPNSEFQTCLPLLIASPKMSDLLIAHGADVNRYCVNGGTALMWGVADIDRVGYLIARHADVNLAKPNSGETPLMLLAGCDDESESVRIARLLIERGADVNARTRSGLRDEPIWNHGNDQNIMQGHLTALHLAAGFGRAQLAKLLLQQGADPAAKTVSRRADYFGPEDKPFPFEPFAGETPVQWAVRHGHTTLIGILSPDLLDDLYWAAAAGAYEQVEKLINEGSDVNAVNSATAQRPLDAAVSGKHRSTCELLIARGARWAHDTGGVVDLAVPEIFNQALRADPAVKERLLASPEKLLEWAYRGDAAQRNSLQSLADAKPETDRDIILAVGLRDPDRVATILARYAHAVKAALTTVPALACWCAWQPELLDAVLNSGANVEARDHLLEATPLHWAIKFDRSQSVQLLLAAGANPNALVTIGDASVSPLLLVVQQRSHCSMGLVEPLLVQGANPNWQMHNGYTALDILDQRWGDRPGPEYERAAKVVRKFGGKLARELPRRVPPLA